MKYLVKKHNKEKISVTVIRAITRLNDYKNQKTHRSIIWNNKSINY